MADCMLVLEKRLESSHRRFLFDISPPLPVDVPMTGNLQRALRLSGVPCRFNHLDLITVKEKNKAGTICFYITLEIWIQLSFLTAH